MSKIKYQASPTSSMLPRITRSNCFGIGSAKGEVTDTRREEGGYLAEALVQPPRVRRVEVNHLRSLTALRRGQKTRGGLQSRCEPCRVRITLATARSGRSAGAYASLQMQMMGRVSFSEPPAPLRRPPLLLRTHTAAEHT
jgi:hypothetical protein